MPALRQGGGRRGLSVCRKMRCDFCDPKRAPIMVKWASIDWSRRAHSYDGRLGDGKSCFGDDL